MTDFSKYAPASLADLRAQEARASGVPAPAATDAAPDAGAPPVAPPVKRPRPAPDPNAPRFVGGKSRERVIPLDYHLEHEGRVYTSITLRRPTSAEVGAWFEDLAEAARADPTARLFLPIFVDEVGDPIPEAVLAALDGDDDEAVMGAAGDFLPRQLRVLWVDPRPASPPQAGEPTAPIS